MLHILIKLLARPALAPDGSMGGVGQGAPLEFQRQAAERKDVQSVSQSAHDIAAKHDHSEKAVVELRQDVATLEKNGADPRLAEASKLIQGGNLEKAAGLIEQVANERLAKLQQDLAKLHDMEPVAIELKTPPELELKPMPGPTAEAPGPTTEGPGPTTEAPGPTAEKPGPIAELPEPQLKPMPGPTEELPDIKLKSWQEITGQPPAPPPAPAKS